MGKFGTKACKAQTQRRTNEREEQEPITDASDAATRALRHLPVAVPPASSTDAYMETAADYQGSLRNDDEVPPAGQSAIESITILIPHTLSSIMDSLTVIGSSRKKGGPSRRLNRGGPSIARDEAANSNPTTSRESPNIWQNECYTRQTLEQPPAPHYVYESD